MKEEWRDIKDWEGFYQVSDRGRVRSLDRTIECSRGRFFNKKGKILSMNKFSGNGYRLCMLTKGRIRKNKHIHRLVTESFIDNLEGKPFVNHIDNNKLNNNLSNLEWATPLENTRHAKKLGVMKHGKDHPSAKLSEKDVRNIYNLAHKGTISQKEIGKLYNISQSNVSDIKRRKLWKDVTLK